MVSKRQLVNSVLVRRLIYNRLSALGFAIGYLERHGSLPPLHKEGFGTGMYDNGSLFIPAGLVFRDVASNGPPEIESFRKDRPTVQELEEIVDRGIIEEGVTLLCEEGYKFGVELSNEFYPDTALNILRTSGVARKIGLPRQRRSRITGKDLIKSYLPLVDGVKIGFRTKLATYISICSVFWEDYWNLSTKSLGSLDSEEFFGLLETSRNPIKYMGDRVLIPPYIIHCFNSRLLEQSMTAPITISGYGARFGAFSMITFEDGDKVLEELKEYRKKRNTIPESNIIAQSGEKKYVGVLRIYRGTVPGSRPDHKEIMLLSLNDLGLKRSDVDRAIQTGYSLEQMPAKRK